MINPHLKNLNRTDKNKTRKLRPDKCRLPRRGESTVLMSLSVGWRHNGSALVKVIAGRGE